MLIDSPRLGDYHEFRVCHSLGLSCNNREPYILEMKRHMPLDPQARQLLDSIAQANLPPISSLSPAQARQQMIAASAAVGEPEAVDSIEDRAIPGSGGEIPIRIYKPQGERLPIVVYYHGGGWVLGNLETHDGYCRALANASNAIVVSVDYRLAPEHKFPAAAEDAFDATRWVSENAGTIGGRSGPLAVAGDSAGGNLAAAVPLMARDRGGPSIGCQVLIYPITDHNLDTTSYQDFANDHLLTRDSMIWFWDQYCESDTDRNHAYLSPLRAEDLQGLPSALVMTAGYDPLCDEGEAYAEKLRQAGVAVALTRYDGMIHGFTRRFDLLDKAHEALNEVADAIKSALNS
jgi:acetyl esterase